MQMDLIFCSLNAKTQAFDGQERFKNELAASLSVIQRSFYNPVAVSQHNAQLVCGFQCSG